MSIFFVLIDLSCFPTLFLSNKPTLVQAQAQTAYEFMEYSESRVAVILQGLRSLFRLR
jgi:hypothetical protein